MRNTSLFLLVTVLLCSCKSKDAFNFSEDLVKIERNVSESITRVQPLVIRYIEVGQMDSLQELGNFMLKKIDSSMTEVKQLPSGNIKQGQEFRNAALDFFGYVRSVYAAYTDYSKQENDSLRAEVIMRMSRLENGVDSVVREMQQAQLRFAKANGFKLEESR